jgi:hypothetical protein
VKFPVSPNSGDGKLSNSKKSKKASLVWNKSRMNGLNSAQELAGRVIFGERMPPLSPGQHLTEVIQPPNTAKDKAMLREWNGQPNPDAPFDPKNANWTSNIPPAESQRKEFSPLDDGKPKLLSGEDQRDEASTGQKSKASRKPANQFLEMTEPEMNEMTTLGETKQLKGEAKERGERDGISW